ncbi:hypothetical protein THRCLA_05971 [Thraustotheca clavata]|uniref:Uncharacterized protein n=1 Tax=Thraustotheca clavata TaxID=74557 RepID=A0A1V9ZQS3_9STRA|nr:hypothetical protein THRCLA_05971 [Thraustotheca clavata]
MKRPKGDNANNGLSGGFFLPAQRSMHCKGGFFTSANLAGHPTNEKPVKPPRRKLSAPTSSKQPLTNQVGEDKVALDSVNVKYELAMKELHGIKVQLKSSSNPAQQSNQESSATTPPAVCSMPNTPSEMKSHSPGKKMQIAEAVIQKLYKKNLELEKALHQAKEEVQQLKSDTKVELPQIINPPTTESVQGIQSQKEEYLKFLAAQQDKTIQELKLKVEKLSRRPETGIIESDSKKLNVIPRLQKRLQEAIDESNRQKANYLRMKQDYNRLLLQRTRTLAGNAEIDSHARHFLALMEKRLETVEGEREQESMIYNMKLFETEKKSCDAFVAKKMLEEEMSKVVQDVTERDAIDDQIDKCILGVFDRLHQVELENIKLRGSTS